jgi:hypothetical protein
LSRFKSGRGHHLGGVYSKDWGHEGWDDGLMFCFAGYPH